MILINATPFDIRENIKHNFFCAYPLLNYTFIKESSSDRIIFLSLFKYISQAHILDFSFSDFYYNSH